MIKQGSVSSRMSSHTGLEQEDTIVRQSSVVHNNPSNSMLGFLREAIEYFDDSTCKIETIVKASQSIKLHKDSAKDGIQKQILGENEDLRKQII